MRVDLPAPFSPQIAWISFSLTSNVTCESAMTPGKLLDMSSIFSMTADCACSVMGFSQPRGAPGSVPRRTAGSLIYSSPMSDAV